jgi:glutaminyl-tRNA synthetase
MEARARRSGRRRMLPALTPVHKPGKVRAAPSTADTGPPALGAVERRTTPGYSSAMTEPRPSQQQDFLRTIVAEDLRTAAIRPSSPASRRNPTATCTFGHATSVVLNFGIAAENGGRCHLRFDDTNPETEDQKYVDSIIDTVSWLGYDWGEHLYFASDYFDRMYAFAEHLIREGKAYVDSLSEEQIREYRGTVMEPGRPEPVPGPVGGREPGPVPRMRDGEFPDGAHVLRARIDMAPRTCFSATRSSIASATPPTTAPATLVRLPALRLRPPHRGCHRVHHPLVLHPRVREQPGAVRLGGGEPPRGASLPFAIPPESRPRQYEFARRNFEYTIVSKRKLLELVREGHVSGWDDPRMPTLAGLRRRGYTPEAVRTFCEMIGIGKAENRADIGVLEYAIRDDLNHKAPRVLCVLRPLKVVLTNYPEGRRRSSTRRSSPTTCPGRARGRPLLAHPLHRAGRLPGGPAPGFFRLSPGAEVRLRYAYVIRCDEVVRDDAGEVVELRCSYYPETRGGKAPEGRTVRGTIHWVSADHAVPCTVRLYDRLFSVADPESGDEDFKTHLNPDSLVEVTRRSSSPASPTHPAGSHYQFERLGFFISDPVDSRPQALVFNRTVTLRDTWAKVAAAVGGRGNRVGRGGRGPCHTQAENRRGPRRRWRGPAR